MIGGVDGSCSRFGVVIQPIVGLSHDSGVSGWHCPLRHNALSRIAERAQARPGDFIQFPLMPGVVFLDFIAM
jgi:hypothetical protein